MRTLPTSIKYGQMLKEKVERGKINHVNYFGLRDDFDEKLTQQPHLSQFIACVEENGVWRVLEEVGLIPSAELLEYRTAQSKVLFSGWELDNISYNYVVLNHKELEYSFGFSIKNGVITNYSIFNDLTTLNLPLTETGVIEFNLKF